MRTTAVFLLQFFAMARAVGELQDTVILDTTPIIVGKNITKLSQDESDLLGELCGRPRVSHLKIHNGKEAKEGQFPWTVRIDIVQGQEEYMCTGTLISQRHVLTAAHCIVANGKSVVPENITISLGGVCVNQKGKCADEDFFKNTTFTAKSKLTSTLRFKAYREDFNEFRGDIAILELESLMAIDERIRPACLPGAREKYSEEQYLYSNGFGRDENHNTSDYLRYYDTEFKTPSYDMNDGTSDCLLTLGPKCGLEPCEEQLDRGDSGSGLLLIDEYRTTVLGPLHGDLGYKLGPELLSISDCYTDIRYYINAICKNAGICYNQANDTEERR